MRRRVSALAVLVVLVAAVMALASGIGGGGGDRGAAPRASGGGGTTAGGTESPRPSGDPDRTVTLRFAGDTVMGTLEYGLPPNGGRDLFGPVSRYLRGDVVMGNLEGTLTTRGAPKCGGGGRPGCFAFRTPPSYAANLKAAGFTVMNIANNHANDFGPVGIADTVRALGRVGLRDTGRPGRYAVMTTRTGVRVAVLGFASYTWANRLEDIPAAVRLVRRAGTEADIVVVTFHGGAEGPDRQHVPQGTEYYLGENRGDLRAFTRAVVAAGADLVVGHGPHVLRGMEFRDGRLIAYSLGNFMGWRTFGLGGPLSTSGVLQVTLRADGRWVSGRFRPTQLVSPGAPVPGGSGVSQIAALSRQDFGARAPRLLGDGTIRRP